MLEVHNIYSGLKAREKEWIKERSYLDLITNSLLSMFKYKAKDKALEYAINLRLEFYLRTFGKVAFTKDRKGNIIFGRATFTGKPNFIGLHERVIITTEGTHEIYERTLGEDAVLIFNNHLMHSELNIGRFVEMLSQVDLSEVDLMLNSRLHPVVICYDEKTKTAVKDALENSKLGQSASIMGSGAIGKELLTGGDPITVLNISEPKNAELFQNYAHYHNDLTGRLYGMYGLSTFNTGKMAQVTDTELSGSVLSSMCYPYENLNCRKMCIDGINELFDLGLSIEFGECWKHQERLVESANLENVDNKEGLENGSTEENKIEGSDSENNN